MFTGKTIDGEEITLYKHVDRPEEIHILLPNGEMTVLGGDAEVSTWYDLERFEMRVDINSAVWVGMAIGTKWELLNMEPR